MDENEYFGNYLIGKDIWNNKYRWRGESFEEWLIRVSGGNPDIEQLIRDKKFLYAGRILANRQLYKHGVKVTYSNCYFSGKPEDNLESIYDTGKHLARTYSYGGGSGVDISGLAPAGARVNNAAKESSGAISFADLYHLTTSMIGMEGRRGALMISLESTHPDLPSFITIKSDNKKLTKANISVKFFDDFLDAVVEKRDVTLRFERETGDVIEKVVNADDLFTKFCENNWDWAEPGIAFWTRIIQWSLISEYTEITIEGLNPCQPLGEYILTSNGFVKIEDITNEVVLNGQSYTSTSMFKTGHKEVFDVTLENGVVIKMTSNHPVTTPNGDVQLGDLQIGDKVTVDYTSIHDSSINDVDEYECGIIAGWFVADGGFTIHHHANFAVGVNEFEFIDALESYIKKHVADDFTFIPHHQKSDTCKVGRVGRIDDVTKFRENILKINTFNKFDVELFGRSKEFKLGFLRALFTCDGSVRSCVFAGIYSVNYKFLQDIQRLLIEFGVYSTLHLHGAARSYTASDNKVRNNKDCWKLSVNDTQFRDIGALTKYKALDSTKVTDKRILNKKQHLKIRSIESIGEMSVYDITVDDVHHYNTSGLVVSNCGEQPLPKDGSCLLGSFNYAEYVKDGVFDFEMFEEDIRKVIRGMNEVLDEGIPLHPHEGQRKMAEQWRFIGVGPMGIADMFVKMGVRFGSRASLDILDSISAFLADRAIRESALLAKEQGAYPAYKAEAVLNSPYFIANTTDETKELVKQYGLRNAQILTIAPTGSISNMLGCSGGVEPIFAFQYERRTESLHKEERKYMIKTPIVFEYMEKNGIDSFDDLPDYFITADKIPYRERIDIQAVLQQHIDASISSTINLPEDTTVEDIKELYLYAWRRGLKGVTTFRKGCKRDGILTTGESDDRTIGELARGYWKPIAPDTVYHPVKVRTGCGKLKLMVGFSEKERALQDFYVIKSGLGGCERTIQSLIITMSGMLRLGGSLSNIEQAFENVGGCTSFSNARCRGKDVSKGNNCGNAILHGVRQFCATLGEKEPTIEPPESPDGNRCPDCNALLEFRVGCLNCPSCGFSKC